MNSKRSWIARLLALVALAAAIVAIVVVASSTHLHSSSTNSGRQAAAHNKQQTKPRTKAKKYTVKSGDTLTSISEKTGVPVSEIQALNPEIDPQILVEGQTLKLQK